MKYQLHSAFTNFISFDSRDVSQYFVLYFCQIKKKPNKKKSKIDAEKWSIFKLHSVNISENKLTKTMNYL